MRTLRSTLPAALVVALATTLGLPASVAGAQGDPLAHLDMGYVEEVTRHLGTNGSSPLGFRVLGTPEDQETAGYVADQMRAIGLEDVAVESFTGDGWRFRGGSVDVQGGGLDASFDASSNGGVPGTAPGGVSGKVVFVGYGTTSEYRGLDVEGKIVFANWDYDHLGIWPNYLAYEATVHGAKAVIMASAPDHAWYSAGNGRALGSNDGECSTTLCAPLAIISKRSAARLTDALAAGSVRATVTLDAENLLDATAYQAIGQITGSTYPDRAIVFTAHQDAWFTSAADDSVAVGMVLAIAKAAIESGYQPEYTWIFAPVTGEEYGLADAYYDWLQGAFHRITVSHTEWQSDAVAILNWEVHSPPYLLDASLPRELRPFVSGSLAASRDDGLIEGYHLSEVYAWQDNFTYTASGAPAVTFGASDYTYWARYHTDYDSIDTLDFPSLLPVLEAETRVALDLDGELAPYDFGKRINHLSGRLDPDLMRSYGADADAVLAALDRLGSVWSAAKSEPPSVCGFAQEREALRRSLDDLTALSFLDDTIYPHEQSQWDLWHLDAAIASVKRGEWDAAQAATGAVDLTSLASILSRESFEVERLHHDPGYAKLSWGSQGQLLVPIDLFGVYRALGRAANGGSTDPSSWLAELRDARGAALGIYRERVTEVASTLDAVAAELEAIPACV